MAELEAAVPHGEVRLGKLAHMGTSGQGMCCTHKGHHLCVVLVLI